MVATLEQHKEIREHGIPGLLSPKGFSIAYEEYMAHLAEELNAATSGIGPLHSPPQPSTTLHNPRTPKQPSPARH